MEEKIIQFSLIFIKINFTNIMNGNDIIIESLNLKKDT